MRGFNAMPSKGAVIRNVDLLAWAQKLFREEFWAEKKSLFRKNIIIIFIFKGH